MIRKLNYTGRKTIHKSRVNIELFPKSDGFYSFDAGINLNEIELPGDANVHVEAYHRTSYMRFYFGKVAKRETPADRTLSQLEPGAFPLFRIKVVRGGRILAAAEKVVPYTTEDKMKGRLSLLPVEFKDMGDLVWDLDLTGERPMLQLNNKIAGIKDIARTDRQFFALVYPIVIKQILYDILIARDYSDAECDDEDWQSQWLRFAQGFSGVGKAPTDKYHGVREDREAWIDEVVAAFCSKWKIRDRFTQHMLEEMG